MLFFKIIRVGIMQRENRNLRIILHSNVIVKTRYGLQKDYRLLVAASMTRVMTMTVIMARLDVT